MDLLSWEQREQKNYIKGDGRWCVTAIPGQNTLCEMNQSLPQSHFMHTESTDIYEGTGSLPSVSVKANSNTEVLSYHVRFSYAVRTLEAWRLPGTITNYFVKGSVKDDTKWTGHMLPPGETGKRSSRTKQQCVWKQGATRCWPTLGNEAACKM